MKETDTGLNSTSKAPKVVNWKFNFIPPFTQEIFVINYVLYTNFLSKLPREQYKEYITLREYIQI